MLGSVEVAKTVLQERISARSWLTGVAKTSCWGSTEVFQESISVRSQIIEAPKISCRDSVEMVEQSETPDQLWQRLLEQYINLDACVEHDPAARALVCERLRERCLKVWPQLGG